MVAREVGLREGVAVGSHAQRMAESGLAGASRTELKPREPKMKFFLPSFAEVGTSTGYVAALVADLRGRC